MNSCSSRFWFTRSVCWSRIYLVQIFITKMTRKLADEVILWMVSGPMIKSVGVSFKRYNLFDKIRSQLVSKNLNLIKAKLSESIERPSGCRLKGTLRLPPTTSLILQYIYRVYLYQIKMKLITIRCGYHSPLMLMFISMSILW